MKGSHDQDEDDRQDYTETRIKLFCNAQVSQHTDALLKFCAKNSPFIGVSFKETQKSL
jgi:hypothetical protein